MLAILHYYPFKFRTQVLQVNFDHKLVCRIDCITQDIFVFARLGY